MKIRVFSVIILLAAGCATDEDSLHPASRGLGTTVALDGRAFRIAVLAPSEGGDLILEGADLTFDRTSGEVSFGAALVNSTERTIFAPLSLVIRDLRPQGIRALNTDGHAEDGSPLYDFSWEVGEDGALAPGESSLGVRMTFADPEGVAFDLGTVLESGLGPPHGAIGGVVFLDQNPDARRDRGESGIPGIPVTLLGAGDANAKKMAETRTDRAGRYRFLNLLPGLYAVRMSAPALATVTPNPIHVPLVPAENGQVSSFLAADLACFRRSKHGQKTPPLLGPLRVLASGETITGHFRLAHLPRMPLSLVVEVANAEMQALGTAEVMINGDQVLTAADLLPDTRFVRRDILPDLLRLGENTIEGRAGSGQGDEVALVVTVFVQ